jgi:acyl-coenzyme A synthetase/AMP-(fatty) acid ligase
VASPAPLDTEWVLLTSGTTGPPKLVVHSRAGLTGAIAALRAGEAPPVWGTFYDIRRYGGLQILLRALLGAGSLVLSDAKEPVGDHLARLGRRGVTHLSGTPSQWRRALMSTAIGAIAPSYVRLSGEIADQAVLDALRRAFPDARIGHAYASTEAGVGFEVTDGREGFPAAFLDGGGPVAMKVVDGSLRLRSGRTATGYVNGAALADAEGFVDSGDMVERRGERCYFAGRRGGIVNVGGLKVHPEEVEAALNRHQAVRMSLVKARPSPITGALVVADVVLADASAPGNEPALKRDIVAFCRAALPPHKVPAQIRFVPALAMLPTGKMARHG